MVDINLLPQKKRRLPSGFYIYALIGFFWLAGAVYLGMLYYDAKNEVASLTQEKTQQEKLLAAAAQQKKGNQTGTLGSYIELSEKLQHIFYPTTFLLDDLAYNLPKQGKLFQINYNLDGKVTVAGRFEQMDDVAAYLSNLEHSEHVRKVNVKTVTAAPVKWTGPVDEDGKPLFLSLQIVGGKMLPSYDAVFEVQTLTIDTEKLQGKADKKSMPAAKAGEAGGQK